MHSTDQNLLLISCSQRKRLDPRLMPAINRYDGPLFRILRKYLRERPTEAKFLRIHVLSAEFGLIDGWTPIPRYDRLMTQARMRELRPQTFKELERLLGAQSYKAILVCMGQRYQKVLTGCKSLEVLTTEVRFASGPLGQKQAVLHDWLHKGQPKFVWPTIPSDAPGKASIRGVDVTLTLEILDLVRRALHAGYGDPMRFHSWYVQVDGQRVSTKWLVSQLTGLPVKEFHTLEAVHVLQKIGMAVSRLSLNDDRTRET